MAVVRNDNENNFNTQGNNIPNAKTILESETMATCRKLFLFNSADNADRLDLVLHHSVTLIQYIINDLPQ